MTALLSFLRALTVALAASDLAVSAVAVEKSKWSFLRTAARNAFADAHAFDKQATRVREEIEKHLCTKQGDAALMGGSYTPGALTAADQRRRSYLKQNSLAIFKNVRAKVFPGASAEGTTRGGRGEQGFCVYVLAPGPQPHTAPLAKQNRRPPRRRRPRHQRPSLL